MVISKILTCNF